MKRGVVAAPAVISRAPRGFTVERTLSGAELRFYLLYWDHIAIPANNLVYIGVPEEQELLSSGAITRPRVQYSGRYEGDQVASAVLGSQNIVAAELNRDLEIDWVMHQFGGDVLAVPSISEGSTVLRIALASVLPVPAADTPIGQVLEFRERRRSDFIALHDNLDALYFDILDSPDRPLASRKQISALRAQIAGLLSDRVGISQWRSFDLSVEFKLKSKDLIAGITVGAGIAALAGLTVPVVAGIGALASLVELKLTKVRSLGGGPKDKLAYLSAAKGERILP